MLKHYKTYDPDNDKYVTCIEHPTDDIYSLCGNRIDETPDGQPETTKEPVTCAYCLQTIKEIKEMK